MKIVFSNKGRNKAWIVSLFLLSVSLLLLIIIGLRFTYPWNLIQIAPFLITMPILIWIILHSVMTLLNYPSWRVEDGKLIYPIRPFKHGNLFWRAGVVPLERIEAVHLGLTMEFANEFGIDPRKADEKLKNTLFFVIKGRTECLTLPKSETDINKLNESLQGKVRIIDVYSPYPTVKVVSN